MTTESSTWEKDFTVRVVLEREGVDEDYMPDTSEDQAMGREIRQALEDAEFEEVGGTEWKVDSWVVEE